MDADSQPSRTSAQRLSAASGVLFVVLFAAGLFCADILSTHWYPDSGDSFTDLRTYFTENRSLVRGLAFFHALASLALLAFAAHVHDLARRTKAVSVLPALAFAGGTTAAAFLLLSTLFFSILSQPATAEDSALLRAVLDLSYLAGGPALLLPLAAFIGATSLIAPRISRFPQWIGRSGIATAAACVLGTSFLLTDGALLLLVPALLLALLWIMALSTVLAIPARPGTTDRVPVEG